MTTHHDIELYPHNQETYDKIIEAWKTQNRVATVQATGTGKTFLILKCLFTYTDVNKVVLAPSNHILDQLSSKVDELPNTTLLTYTELSFMSKEAIQQLNASMIVLDEFHRCGAEKWGEGINKLIAAFPNAKLLGTTATPIRYLDGARDMSDELFDGNVATNLSLTEAIVKGILPMPKYVSALYTFDEEIMNLKDKIDKSSNTDEEKEGFYKEVEQLKKDLDKSKGIPVILKKYLGDSTGKFIVFCRNKKHLLEMQSIVKGWFKKAKLGKGIDTYSVYTGKTESENNKIIENFVLNQNYDNIRLLFTIDMLNEGLHVEDIDGVICLRPTVSPIIYYQQIGRALQVGSKEPFVFDLVNNFNNLGGDTFGNDLKDAAEKENRQRKSRGESELGLDNFIVYDEIHNAMNLFNELEGRLIDNWDTMFEQYIRIGWDYEDRKLINWIKHQRAAYREGRLNKERINKLNEVDFIWNELENLWSLNYELLLQFKEEQGHVDVPNRFEFKGNKLGNWVHDQRKKYKRGELTQERIDRLELIGFLWEVLDLRWKKGFNELQNFKMKHGHVDVPLRYRINDFNLGQWVQDQRKKYKRGSISKERIRALRELGFQWEIIDNSWEIFYSELTTFKKMKGHVNIPQKYEVNDLKLGQRVSRQRQAYKKGELPQKRINKLNLTGFLWYLPTKEEKLAQ
ncbi:Helicase associated domain protein [Paenibacillus sp. CMAA1739]|uniref:Helicase associated domain protein n=1 Tax=Paenibacillus ottowii TaxID=2315729 RepID=UPI002DB86D54|nr:Helicase associated domain protein [Paenibacillus sp. CMAA1739]MEC4565384.1 Helicase associated domain protein [Paenibacillus sp. CMAA1739]